MLTPDASVDVSVISKRVIPLIEESTEVTSSFVAFTVMSIIVSDLSELLISRIGPLATILP